MIDQSESTTPSHEPSRNGAGTWPDWKKQPPAPEVIRFLQGPQNRGFELARVIRILFECIRGFRALHFVGPCVTVFGSARCGEDHASYQLARDMG